MNSVSSVARRFCVERMSHCRMLSSAPSTNTPSKLEGRVAIVTASTEGIGFGIAQSLASHGASVMISSRKVNIKDFDKKNLFEFHKK